MSAHDVILHDSTASQHRPVAAGDVFDVVTKGLITDAVVTAGISTDAGNQLVAGSDNKLKVPAAAAPTFLADTDTPAAYTGHAGNLVVVNATETGLDFSVPPPVGVSADAGNDIVLGSDNKPYLAETVTVIKYDGAAAVIYTDEAGVDTKLDLSPMIVQPGTNAPLMDGVAASGASAAFSREDHVHPTDTSRAPLASPAFTGTPTAPTPAAGDNTTKLATTAFVNQVAATINGALPGTTNPLMNGVVSQGVSGNFSREDHVHPTDTTRAPLASPAFTGTPTAPTPAAGDSTTKLATTAFVTGNMPVVSGLFRNLKANATGTNASVAVTVDEIVLGSAANAYVTARNVNLTINSAGAGANGLDTGALAASTWYSVWVIYNPTTLTVAGLLSLSATAPTLPAGYTFYTRVGWIRTDATASKFPLGFTQYGRRVRYKVTAGSNVAAMPIISTGIQGSATTPTWVAKAVANFVPTTASSIVLTLDSQGSACTVVPSSAYGAISSTTNAPLAATNAVSSLGQVEVVLESANIYVAANGATSVIFVYGWEDNL